MSNSKLPPLFKGEFSWTIRLGKDSETLVQCLSSGSKQVFSEVCPKPRKNEPEDITPEERALNFASWAWNKKRAMGWKTKEELDADSKM